MLTNHKSFLFSLERKWDSFGQGVERGYSTVENVLKLSGSLLSTHKVAVGTYLGHPTSLSIALSSPQQGK